MKRRLHRRGLTLLELMIVLIILVGLIALVGPRLLGSQRKADVKTTQAQIGNLVSALKLYSADMRTFPTTEEGLDALLVAPDDEEMAKKWDGPYVEGSKLPSDPWGNQFVYEYSAEENADFPRIISPGPDKQVGTSDDIANRESADAEKDGGRTEKGRSGSRNS